MPRLTHVNRHKRSIGKIPTGMNYAEDGRIPGSLTIANDIFPTNKAKREKLADLIDDGTLEPFYDGFGSFIGFIDEAGHTVTPDDKESVEEYFNE